MPCTWRKAPSTWKVYLQFLCGGEPSGDVAAAINQSCGSFASFKETFTNAATSLFGSADYIQAFWNIVNWDFVAENLRR